MEITNRLSLLRKQVLDLRRSSSCRIFPVELRKEALALATIVGNQRLIDETGISPGSIYQWKSLYPETGLIENHDAQSLISVTRVVVDQNQRTNPLARFSTGSFVLELFTEQAAVAIAEAMMTRGLS